MMATGYLDSSGNINSTNFKEWFETSDLGAFFIGLVNNGLILAGLDVSQQQVVQGAIIVIAVILSRKD